MPKELNMENTGKTSLLQNGLIWFGAGVSLAEILTGTYFAPLGFASGIAAIVIGHIIGCVLLFLAGYIGARTCKSAMETAAMCFGKRGAVLFAILNVIQLVGWTGIMIYDGALSANTLINCGMWVWCLVIGALIVAWICLGSKSLEKVNIVAMSALFVLTVVFCVVAFGGIGTVSGGAGLSGAGAGGALSGAASATTQAESALNFGAAVELAVAMPLSWLPLVSDYTRNAARPLAATITSTLVYGLVSCWMYAIGMAMAILTGESDIAQIMLQSGLGIAGLIIVIFSTVTTTFLDANSAGVSFESICTPFKVSANGKVIAVVAALFGIVGAIIFPMDDITDFLYLIGSVFAPMIAVLVASYFVLKENCANQNFNWINLVIWLIGFVLYRIFMGIDTPIGYTLPCMLIVALLTLLVGFVAKRIQTNNN
jgi:purine-cytosine permease-like protein